MNEPVDIEQLVPDTGCSDNAPLLAQALSQLGRHPTDVERIVLSHFHDDHVGAAAEIAGWSPSTVVAGRDDSDVISGRAPRS